MAVVDLEPVQVLVLQGAEGAFADAVLLRALAAGADVDQLRAPLDVGGEADRLEARAVIGDDRESAILETAEELLKARPLADISVDDLAKGAGISRPTFYFYFRSKDAVLQTLLERVIAEADASLQELVQNPPAERNGLGTLEGAGICDCPGGGFKRTGSEDSCFFMGV